MRGKKDEVSLNLLNIIKNNDSNELERYLKEHDVNEEIQGQNLLTWTVYLGNWGFTNLLIEKGASVNKKDRLVGHHFRLRPSSALLILQDCYWTITP
nr:hypothetical protein [Bacillus licheniformis]